jgi:hypothetical protein
MKITEIKTHIDGRIEKFECELLSLSQNFAIVEFIWDRDEPHIDGPMFLPAGKIYTHAYFWEDRNYLIYKISEENGNHLGVRFDVCMNVSIEPDLITFDDLVLDLWIDSRNKIHVLDEDEVESFGVSGLLSAEQLELIEKTKTHLVENHQEIIESLNS